MKHKKQIERFEPLDFRRVVEGLWEEDLSHGRDLLPLETQADLSRPGLSIIGGCRVRKYDVDGEEVE